MKREYELLAPVGDLREIESLEVLGIRSLSLLGVRFEVGQLLCQFRRLDQLYFGGFYE